MELPKYHLVHKPRVGSRRSDENNEGATARNLETNAVPGSLRGFWEQPHNWACWMFLSRSSRVFLRECAVEHINAPGR